MKEDNQLARKEKLPENLNIIKKIEIEFLNQETTIKRSKPYKYSTTHF